MSDGTMASRMMRDGNAPTIRSAIAGRGKKLWTNVSKLQRIQALETKVLPSGIVIEKYARAR